MKAAVPYTVVKDDVGVYSVCPCVTNEHLEFVSAYDIYLDSQSQMSGGPLDVLRYKKMLHGIYGADHAVDVMIAVDCVLGNRDRHWSNFGILRDSCTLEWKAVMPLFDCGDSLCHDCLEPENETVFGKLTGRELHDDLGLITTDIDLNGLSDGIAAVADMFRHAEYLRPSRRYQLADIVSQRGDRVLQYLDGKDYDHGLQYE